MRGIGGIGTRLASTGAAFLICLPMLLLDWRKADIQAKF